MLHTDLPDARMKTSIIALLTASAGFATADTSTRHSNTTDVAGSCSTFNVDKSDATSGSPPNPDAGHATAAKFTVTYNVPEPAAALIGGLGLLRLLSRRRE
jgi:hypothetical protein